MSIRIHLENVYWNSPKHPLEFTQTFSTRFINPEWKILIINGLYLGVCFSEVLLQREKEAITGVKNGQTSDH